MKKSSKTLGLVQVALIGAIIILMAALPVLGYIPLGFMNATIIHVPVIIASIVLGPKKGAVLGFIFGLTSLVRSTTTPNLTSFVFSPFYRAGDIGGSPLSLIVCFVPRILTGVTPYYVYKGMSKLFKGKRGSDTISIFVSGIVGSLTNTLLVMNFIYIFFGKSYAVAQHLPKITESISNYLPNLPSETVTSLARETLSLLSIGADAAAKLTSAGIPLDTARQILDGINLSASQIYNTFIISTICFVGIPEAIVAAIITAAVVKPLMKTKK